MTAAFQSSAFEQSAFQVDASGVANGVLSGAVPLAASISCGVGVSGTLISQLPITPQAFNGYCAPIGGLAADIVLIGDFTAQAPTFGWVEGVLPLSAGLSGAEGTRGSLASLPIVIGATFSAAHGLKGQLIHQLKLDAGLFGDVVLRGQFASKLLLLTASAFGSVGCSGAIHGSHRLRAAMVGRLDAPNFSHDPNTRATRVIFERSEIVVTKRVGA